MNTKQIAEEQWTEETVRMIIADVPVGDAPEVIAAAHNSAIVDRRELAHREYHRGYQDGNQDGRKSLAAAGFYAGTSPASSIYRDCIADTNVEALDSTPRFPVSCRRLV